MNSTDAKFYQLSELHSPAPKSRPPRAEAEKIAESISLVLIFLVAFLANGTICTALAHPIRRRTAFNLLLISLTLANLLISVLVVPFALASVISDKWLFGSLWCHTTGFLMSVLMSASNLSVAVIAVYRYYLIVKPLSVKIDLPRARRMTGFIWMTSLVLGLPPLFGWNTYSYSPGKAYCTVTWLSTVPGVVYCTFYACVVFLVPVFLLVFVYRAIYIRAKKQRQRTGYDPHNELYSNGYMGSSHSLDLLCGCFPRGNVIYDRDYYGRKPSAVPYISSVSTSSLSPDFSPQASPTKSTEGDYSRRSRITRTVSTHSRIIQQRTFQSASAIVTLLVVSTIPYVITNMYSSFTYNIPNYVIDFVTSWLCLSLVATHPITYGFSSRPIRRLVLRLPWLRLLWSARDIGHWRNGDYRPSAVHRNEALEESTA
ncbi:G-protein coupled receptor 161 isoform X1 [Nematostella vectensis]|uniref:G-protein coupled receptor 161 isoform X1 n=1 Tax=Nematostella vectensis TaxID=45351 RepID=UPI0020770B21|nr:G-protein coupled receptor 161 isoform X1 [Nematostella vectensis]